MVDRLFFRDSGGYETVNIRQDLHLKLKIEAANNHVRYEKGTFFECNLELNEEFNPAMLTLIMDDLEEQRYVNGLTYNGVSAENIGGDTRDTSSMFSVFNINNIS